MANLYTIHHKGGWAAIPNRILEDSRLSWKAKGLWSYLQSRPDGWTVRQRDILARSTDGRDGIRGALAELEEAGWLTRDQSRSGGKFDNVVYHLHEPDETRVLATNPPWTENPATVFPATENPPPSNTEDSKTEENETHSGGNRSAYILQATHWLTVYPERPEPHPKGAVYKAYIAARESGISEQQLLDAAINYKQHLKKTGKLGTRYIYSAIRFISSVWEEWVDMAQQPDFIQASDGTRYLR